MEQIRIGLKHNLDISLYSNKKFNEDQMKEIRLGLELNLDVSSYANPIFSEGRMKQIRKRLLKKSTQL